tara:strand:+ start:117 stop:626 length:510 start_codon:yes stop_codon:yes gene_type:complete
MEKNGLIHVATFGHPQGLKGGIKINILTSSFESFKKLKNYFIESNKSNLIFQSIKKIGKNYVVFLKDCNDRDQATYYVGKKIFVLRKDFPKIKYNEYYKIDLISCDVFNIKMNFLGKIKDIKNFGAGDLFEIKNSEKNNFYIPMNDDNVVKIDIKKKQIIVNPITGLLD